ncbi:MAG: long-chain acyl-CoA synthetase, partial [Myxococcota bacterium]
DIKIAEDGEILMSGRGIMKGYYNNEEATAESLSTDADGKVWLRTGDIGTVLDSGHVKITDRKKEIIITAGGKNIAPAHVQNKLKARCLYVSEVLMHGDKRNFCVALIAINEDSVGKWAAKNGIAYTDYADLAGKSEVKALIWEDMKAINEELPSYETIKKIALLPEDMSVENGQLTPSMKVKRRIVEDTYKDILDGFYSDTVAAM